ncbi:MAG: RNA polymerase sigma factor [Myxococcaceae bacterium]
MSRSFRIIPLMSNPAASAPLAERSDDDLMLLSSADRRDAFAVLVERYLPRLTQFSARFLGGGVEGEEVAQETMFQVWAARREYRPEGRFATWIFTIARNRCRNAARHAGLRGRVDMAGAPQGHDPDAPTPAAIDALLEQERQRRVQEVLLGLPEKLKEAVLLRFNQGLEYSEIARILGCPEATVRSRVFHGIKRLRAQLAPEDA